MDQNSQPQPEEVAAPSKAQRRRRRWPLVLVALLILIGAAVLAVLVVKPWRDVRVARTRLAATVDSLRLAGAPVALKDLGESPVPEEENAVPLLREAGRALAGRGARGWGVLPNAARPLEGDEPARTATLIDANRDALALARRATRRPGVAWGLQLQSPLLTMSFADFREQGQLVKVLRGHALHRHHEGDDAGVLQDVRDMTFISRAVGRQPTLVGYLSGLHMEAMAVDIAGMAATDLNVTPEGSPAGGSVTPAEVRALVNDLLDERPLREALVHGLSTERVSMLDSLDGLLSGKFGGFGQPARGREMVWWFQRNRLEDMVLSSADLIVRQITRQIEAADEPTWPAFVARVPAAPPETLSEPGRYLIANIMLPSLHRGSRQYYRELTDHRLAAVALAVRLYRVDHGGQFPAALDDLLPGYLKAIPLDPYAPDRGPLRYRNDPDRPRVYSVGEDGGDHGGAEPDPSDPRRQYEHRVDLVRHLKRQPRPAPVEPPVFPGLPPGMPLPPGIQPPGPVAPDPWSPGESQ